MERREGEWGACLPAPPLLNKGMKCPCFPEFALYCAVETQYTHHTRIVIWQNRLHEAIVLL